MAWERNYAGIRVSLPGDRFLTGSFFLLFACGIARVPRGFSLCFKRDFTSRLFFLFARQLGGRRRRQLLLPQLLLRFSGIARKFCLGAFGGYGLALGLPPFNSGVIRTRLATKLLQN